MREHYQNRIELLQGTLDLLILQALQWGRQHGYGIGQTIGTNSGEVLQIGPGPLYPALRRLERRKWVSSELKVSERRQRVKAYQSALSGKKKLLLHRSRWKQPSEAMASVLNPARKGGGA